MTCLGFIKCRIKRMRHFLLHYGVLKYIIGFFDSP